MKIHRCDRCRFWSQVSAERGQCRVRSPQAMTMFQEENVINNWPLTTPDAWCQQWSESRVSEIKGKPKQE